MKAKNSGVERWASPFFHAAAMISFTAVASLAQAGAAIAEENTSAPYVRVEPRTPRPALKAPKRGAWPFGSWSYAKAYTYNFFQMRAQVLVDVVSSDGTWNKHIRSEQLISDKQALSAADLVAESKGSFRVWKCFFPRHAIVMFDQSDRPVAAANVCFECEGIGVWPDYERPKGVDNGTGEKRFLAVLANWETLFGAELGLPVNFRNAQ